MGGAHGKPLDRFRSPVTCLWVRAPAVSLKGSLIAPLVLPGDPLGIDKGLVHGSQVFSQAHCDSEKLGDVKIGSPNCNYDDK